jgi:hypothetical protein
MEGALALIPGKYAADFRALIEDPLFVEQPDTRSQMVIATRILRQKGARTIFRDCRIFWCLKGHNSAALEAIEARIVSERTTNRAIRRNHGLEVSSHRGGG